MVTIVRSSAISGISGIDVRVETDVSPGLPSFQIVGLGDASVQESRDRVRSAIRNSGFSFPAKRVTVNLSPADVRKTWPAFDLAIALAIVSSETGILPSRFENMVILGELALDGEIRSAGAIIAHTASARERRVQKMLVPASDVAEASMVPWIEIVGVTDLRHAVWILTGKGAGVSTGYQAKRTGASPHEKDEIPDFGEIRGQTRAKRALEIAAAGSHNVLLEGAPGSGKTLLCRAFAGILPPPDSDELLEIAKIRSIALKNRSTEAFSPERPFRTIHPSASVASLLWGGPSARPGEISLAHLGTLFLDEMREFPTSLLESLRQPLEDGEIRLSRANVHVTYPARFQLLAATNPCPCGYLHDDEKRCECPPGSVERYRAKISGPMLDRIDLFVPVPRLSSTELAATPTSIASDGMRQRVSAARALQTERYGGPYKTNASLSNREIDRFLRPDPEAERLLLSSLDRFRLSSRAFFRIKKVARTIADLAKSETVTAEHMAEAVWYRERESGGQR